MPEILRPLCDYIIIADLHLGLGLCHWQTLKTLFESIRVKTIIIAGDLFHYDHHDKKRNLALETKEIITYLNRLTKERNVEIIWLKGNHDQRIKNSTHFKEALSPYYFTYRTERLCIMHGHEFDKHEQSLSKSLIKRIISKIIASIYYLALKRSKRLTRLVEVAKNKIAIYNQGIKDINEKAFSFAKERDIDVLIAGHTHEMTEIADKTTRYINCGCWIETCCSYVEILDGKISLKTIKANR